MGQAQQSELAKDRALQEQLHSQAMRELQEMKVREDELVQVEKVQLAAQLQGSRQGGVPPEHKAFLEEIWEADEAGVADEDGPARAGRGSWTLTGAPQRAQVSLAKAALADAAHGRGTSGCTGASDLVTVGGGGGPDTDMEYPLLAAQANGVSGVAVPRPDSHVLRSYVDKVDVE